MELGISSFVDYSPDPTTGKHSISPTQRMKNLMEEIELTEQVGLDVFAIGEHHRKDYLVSSPATVLAAAAVKTRRIKLSSAVTVLSSDDPVRVFQQFATVDLLSEGRAEIMAGRGSFIESFPLFGYDLDDYDTLFSEKLGLLVALNENEKITWSGKHRAPIHNRGVYPRPHNSKMPIWVAVGGTPASALRAGEMGLPMMVAIIGGDPRQFVAFTRLFRESAAKAGHNNLPLGINSHTYVADTSQQAADEFYPAYADVMSRIGRERGWSGMTRAQYDASRAKHGALLVGSPDEVAEKILYEHALFGHTRFLAQMTVGAQPHAQTMRSIELFGTKVAPTVRKALNIT
ncbi:MAG TPA: LLM class flavin-dependent oxidoreductase [Chitinophagales bacterium]|nr:LLM class flavin-dependent oxidoreductase [Chitinophagales bacterium]